MGRFIHRLKLYLFFRYDQHLSVGEEREENRLRFSGVITFVENYLQNISSNIWSFSDKEQNKLTFEVCDGNLMMVMQLFLMLWYVLFGNLRAIDSRYGESNDSSENSDFLLLRQKDPFGELFSEIYF